MRWQSNFTRMMISLGMIALCSASIIHLQKFRMRSFKSLDDISAYQQQEKQLAINLDFAQKIPAFGFNNIVADWSYLQFIQYFGDTEVREKVGYSLVPQYFKLLVQHDPQFLNAYVQLSPACSIFAGRPDLTVAFMNQALSSMNPQSDPEAYYLWFYKGLDELLFLGNIPSAKNSYLSASQWARLSPSPASNQLADTAEKMTEYLKKNPDSRGLRISSWMLIYHNTLDQRVKDYVVGQIRQLGGNVIVSNENGEPHTKVIMPSTP